MLLGTAFRSGSPRQGTFCLVIAVFHPLYSCWWGATRAGNWMVDDGNAAVQPVLSCLIIVLVERILGKKDKTSPYADGGIGVGVSWLCIWPAPVGLPVQPRLPVVPHAAGGDRTAHGSLPKFAEHVGSRSPKGPFSSG